MAADETAAPNGSGAASGSEPTVQLLGQYVKDLSFENPNAPQSFLQQNPDAKLEAKIGVAIREIGANVHEVSLTVENKLVTATATLFQLELDYAGAFRIENLPADVLHQVLRVQCPSLLFPFARRLIADLTRDGGFPQLYLDPVDFGQLYMQEMARQQASSGGRQIV